jgi:hypothetical protein
VVSELVNAEGFTIRSRAGTAPGLTDPNKVPRPAHRGTRSIGSSQVVANNDPGLRRLKTRTLFRKTAIHAVYAEWWQAGIVKGSG